MTDKPLNEKKENYVVKLFDKEAEGKKPFLVMNKLSEEVVKWKDVLGAVEQFEKEFEYRFKSVGSNKFKGEWKDFLQLKEEVFGK